MQNFAAHIITGTRKFDHITPALRDLGWLPVKQQLFFRDAVMAFKCMTGQAPHYLSDQFTTGGHRACDSKLPTFKHPLV